MLAAINTIFFLVIIPGIIIGLLIRDNRRKFREIRKLRNEKHRLQEENKLQEICLNAPSIYNRPAPAAKSKATETERMKWRLDQLEREWVDSNGVNRLQDQSPE
jgi:hypothetical protein